MTTFYNSSLYHLLSDKEKSAIARRGRQVDYAERKCLFRQGDQGESFYIIKRGSVTLSVSSPNGEELILNRLSDGEAFGEIALLDGGPRTTDAFAEKNSTLILLDKADFAFSMENSPVMQRAAIDLLCRRVRWCSALLEDFMFHDTLNRLIFKLVLLSEKHDNLTDSLIEISQEELAKMLGTTRESLNRNLKFLHDRGFVVIERRKITIPDVIALKNILEEGPKDGNSLSYMDRAAHRKGK